MSAGEVGVGRFIESTPRLAEILVDAVASGASVGFVQPFAEADAEAWWRSLIPEVESGRVVIILASDRDGRVVGTAQLRLAQMPNQRHRADVAKVLVHREARRRGLGRMLMSAIETSARARGRTLLVLDTVTGSDADRMYERLGWTRAGAIPNYATMPDGTLAPTTFFYKELR